VITIPDNVKTIAEKAFYNSTGLTSVVIPESVTSIEKQAFYYCTGLKSIVIPDSISTIGYEAFYSVKRIYYGGAATGSPWGAIWHIRGNIFDGDFVYADEQKTILAGYIGSDSIVDIPNQVKIIGIGAFLQNQNLYSVNMSNSVVSIEEEAFRECPNLTYVALSDSITSIGTYAFFNNKKLTSVTIPESVTTIEECAFDACKGISSVIVPNPLASIGSYAFRSIDTLYFAGSVTGSPWGAKLWVRGTVIDGDFVYSDEQKENLVFYRGNDSVVIISDQVKVIDEYAFYNKTKLSNVIFPDSLTSIKDYAFYDCVLLSSVSVPNDVNAIGTYAFRGADTLYYGGNVTGSPWGARRHIKGVVYDGDFVYSDKQKTILDAYLGNDSVVTIPDQVKVVDEYAFYNKTKLSNVIFPDSLTAIKDYAFDNCVLLSSVSVPNDVNAIGTYAFRGTDTLFYGGNATGSPWGARRYIKGVVYDGDFVYSDEQKTILDAYLGNDSVVTIPDQVKVIDEYAFYNKTKLSNVIFPDSLTTIKNYAFDGCDQLSLVIVPNTVNTIGTYAFRGTDILCYGGNAVGASWGAKRYLKESFTDGGIVYADEGRTNIIAYVGTASVVVIPNSVTSIDANTFSGIETIYYAGTATGSPWGAKRHKRGLVDGDFIYADEGKTKLIAYAGMDSVVVIPKQVKTIGDSAFYGNTKITAVTFSDSVSVIGVATFKNCTSLSSLIVPNSVTKIGTDAFSGIDTVCYLMETDTILIIKDFYIIHNLQELLTYRDINHNGYHLNGRLDADIDLSPVCGIINGEIVNWETINLGDAMFDGGNHTITNLYINRSSYYIALLNGRHIENLTVKNAYVKGTDAAGITSCTSPLLLVNCHFEGVVIGTDFAGGLNLYGKASTLVNCSNYGLVVGGKNVADGIYAQKPINCYNRGRIVSNESTAKGVGMYCCCNPTNCYNAGAIISTEAYSIYEAYKSCFNLKIEGINLFDGENVQQMDSSAFLSGAVTDSLNKYVAQNPKTYDGWTIKDSIPLLPWVQGEDGFPRFEGVDLQPTQGYAVRFTGAVNDIEVSRDGTIALPVSPDGYTYIFANDFDGKNIVSDTTVTVAKILNPNFLERDKDEYYLIHNGHELALFRDVVNDGATTINGRLANDIDLSQECKDSVWIPIGVYKNRGDYIAFEGVFDGAGHSIEHLYNITDSPYQGESTHWYRGLFGNTKNATIQNVVVKNSRITGFCVSAIVASAENTTIVNCGSEAELYGYSDHGAASMCAIMERNTKVINCYNLGVVGGEYQAAAIACHAYGNLELVNCYSSAIITLNYRSGNEETGPFCNVEHCVRCFTDSEICNFNYEMEGVTKTSTDYIKSDAFLTDMNAWVDSMNAAQSEIVFARWVRDEVDGYPKLQQADSSSVSTKEYSTTPDGISVYALGGTIYIRSAHTGEATLYDIHGRAVASVAYTAGLTTVDGLASGLYVLKGIRVLVK